MIMEQDLSYAVMRQLKIKHGYEYITKAGR